MYFYGNSNNKKIVRRNNKKSYLLTIVTSFNATAFTETSNNAIKTESEKVNISLNQANKNL